MGEWRFGAGFFAAGGSTGSASFLIVLLQHRYVANTMNTTPRGFEPLLAEPNVFRGHLPRHSDTVSWGAVENAFLQVYLIHYKLRMI